MSSEPRVGTLALVVGPSGVGKDTLLRLARAALADRPDIHFPRRVVTREADASEDHDTLSPEAFDAAEAAGGFALSWRAHDRRYGIPATILPALDRGDTVVCNVSRAVLEEARRRFPRVRVIQVTASREALAARLAARGRAEDTGARLARAVDVRLVQGQDLELANDGAPEEAAARLAAFLADRT